MGVNRDEVSLSLSKSRSVYVKIKVLVRSAALFGAWKMNEMMAAHFFGPHKSPKLLLTPSNGALYETTALFISLVHKIHLRTFHSTSISLKAHHPTPYQTTAQAKELLHNRGCTVTK